MNDFSHYIFIGITILIFYPSIQILIYLFNKLIFKFSKGKSKLQFDGKKIQIWRNKNLIEAARIAYVELSNRKVSFKFDEKYDSISEVFNSFYSCFKTLRNILKKLDKNDEDEKKLYENIENFLNLTLRKELIIYQKPYREWLKKQQEKKHYKNEIIEQKKYEYYINIIKSFEKINSKVLKIKNAISIIAYNQ